MDDGASAGGQWSHNDAGFVQVRNLRNFLNSVIVVFDAGSHGTWMVFNKIRDAPLPAAVIF